MVEKHTYSSTSNYKTEFSENQENSKYYIQSFLVKKSLKNQGFLNFSSF